MPTISGNKFLKEAVTSPRMIRLSGGEKVGKSSFSLQVTAPGADDEFLMHYFDWDQGLERAAKYLKARGHLGSLNIHSYPYPSSADLGEEEFMDLLSQWQDDWEEAYKDLEDNRGGVVVFDTETQWTDIVTVVKTNAALSQRLNKRKNKERKGVDYVQRLDYGMRNAFIEKTMLSIKAIPNTKMVAISRITPEFGTDGKTTGRMLARGYKDLGNVVDLHLRLLRLPKGRRRIKVEFDGFEDSNTGRELDDYTWPELEEELW